MIIAPNGQRLRPGTPIDLVLHPGMSTYDIMRDMVAEDVPLVVIDTQGNLYHTFGESSTPNVEYYFVGTATHFTSLLDELATTRLSEYILIIDSITFVVDCTDIPVPHAARMLWRLLYNAPVTILTINHYKLEIRDRKTLLMPRMGQCWPQLVTYQLLFHHSENKLTCDIQKGVKLDYE